MRKEIGVEKIEIMIPVELKEEMNELFEMIHGLPANELKYFFNFIEGVKFAKSMESFG